MVILLFKEDISKNKELIEETILNGGIIVYPTDTLYGIGGRADIDEVVDRVYEIKQRDRDKEVGVIVPDFEYIKTHCEITEQDKKLILAELPGRTTFKVVPKESCLISKKAYLGKEKVNIRICNHFIQDIIYNLQIPIVTTSANISRGEDPTFFEKIPAELLKQCDLVLINDDNMSRKQSKLIEL